MRHALLLATLLAAGAALAPAAARADEQPVPLADGAGRDTVEQNCAACHSLDYIRMNSHFLDGKGWEASVTKMINAFGAPIDAKDVKPIVEYLAKHYGS
jgi:cytochrome c5